MEIDHNINCKGRQTDILYVPMQQRAHTHIHKISTILYAELEGRTVKGIENGKMTSSCYFHSVH